MLKQSAVDMTEGPITKKLLLFSLPIMLSGILQLLYNAADVVVVGRFAGHTSLAAVGSTSSLVTLITNFAMGLSVGVNVIIARHIGAKDSERVDKALHTAATLSIFAGIITAVLGFFISRTALELMGSPADVIDKSTLYLKIYFLGAPASVIYNFGSAALRSAGDTTRPLYFLTASGIVNVLLNLVFVIVFHMDVAGVALATIISQYMSAALVVMALKKGQGMLFLRLSSICFDKKEFGEIIRLGIPAAIQSSAFSISNVILQSGVNSFDDSLIIAGNSAASNIEGFIYVSLNAFHQTAVNFMGQNAGAGQYKRVSRTLWICLGSVTVVGLAVGSLAYLFGPSLLSLYITDSQEAISYGMLRLSLISLTYFLCGLMDVSTGALRGLGESFIPMVISVLGVCGIRIGWIYTIFQLPQFHTPQCLYLSYPISWAITFLCQMFAFLLVYRKLKQD